MTATVDVGGPFKIETKPYNIAAKVVLAADEKPKTPTPVAQPAGADEAPEPEPAQAEPAEIPPMAAQAAEEPTTEKKGPNWIILSALIGLGVAGAGIAVFKKTFA